MHSITAVNEMLGDIDAATAAAAAGVRRGGPRNLKADGQPLGHCDACKDTTTARGSQKAD